MKIEVTLTEKELNRRAGTKEEMAEDIQYMLQEGRYWLPDYQIEVKVEG